MDTVELEPGQSKVLTLDPTRFNPTTITNSEPGSTSARHSGDNPGGIFQ